ncbi:Ig-like domain-containing protein [Chitinophaga sp. sic0106]|uniref:Ig-like domain-containing protein n=1 Tax=Chitinophaga sp. sic0106 TaxID=2854785 RepID=UPI001C4380D1|nr:Ig-like domain-containing protein [Chitinophaga sp. sic0106]MBV7529104.1 Ig-like domain-containing protein [Chitinophaga sp. sic0106]
MKKVCTSFLFLLISFQLFAQNICYVKKLATPGGDGRSWATAFNNMDDAIAANTNDPAVNKIYVAEGTYVPAIPVYSSVPGTKTYNVLNNLSIYGGFPSNASGTMGLESANPTLYITTFGDPSLANNNKPIRIFTVLARSLELQGVTIAGGFAQNRNPPAHIYYSASIVASESAGGGIQVNNGTLTLRQCILKNNSSLNGGAVYSTNSTVVIDRCLFKNNYGYQGAALYFTASPATVSNSIFIGNTTDDDDGNIITNNSYDPRELKVMNCSFYDNRAPRFVLGKINILVYNNIFALNKTNANGMVASYDPGAVTSGFNFTLHDETGIERLWPGYAQENFMPGENSDVINNGNNTVASGLTQDYNGNNRIFAGTVDMGAIESPWRNTATTTSFTGMDKLRTNAASVRFRVMFTTAISGLSVANFQLSGTATSAITNLQNDPMDLRAWIITVTPSTEGTVGLTMINDNGLDYRVLNFMMSDQGYTIDRTPPELRTPVMGSNNGITPSRFAKAGDVVSITFNTNEPVTSAGGTISGINMSTTATGNNYRAYVIVQSNTPEGLVVPDCSFGDAAGNISKITSTSFTAGVPITIDRTAPALTVNPLTVYPNSQGAATVTMADLTLSATDNYTTPGEMVYGFNTTTLNWASNMGTTNLNVTARDLAGNVTTQAAAVTLAKRKIVAIASLPSMNIPFGTAPATVVLPATVKITYNTGEIEDRPLLWNTDNLQTQSVGPKILYGGIIFNVFDDGDNKTVISQPYVVGPKIIRSIAAAGDITRPYGTSLSGLTLPSKVFVNIVNQGFQEQVPVTWNTTSYNPASPGTYTFTGTLNPPQGYTNPNGLSTSITVILEKRHLTAYTTIPVAVLPVGYSGPLVKPAQIAVSLSDGTNTSYPVIWNGTADYNTIGNYVFTGSIQLDSKTDNALGIIPTFTISVVKRNMQTLESPAGATVAYGTAFAQLPLPATLYTIYNSNLKENIAINWQEGTYNRLIPGTYTINGDPVADAISTNNLNLKAIINITVDKRYITATATLPPIHVPFGSNASALVLPSTVAGTYIDNATVNTGITWNGNADFFTAGIYTYTGTLVMDNVSDNRNNLQVTQEVIVDKRNLTGIAPVGDITVPYNTTFYNIGLPATTQLSFDDHTSVAASISWDGAAYQPATPGEYLLPATFTLDANTLNPDNISLHAKVIVDKRYVTATAILPPIHVPYGSSAAALQLPANIHAVYSDQSNIITSLTWNGNADFFTAGTYTYTGTLVMDNVSDNRNNLQVTQEVMVDKRYITAITAAADITVPLSSDPASITLPANLSTTFSDGTTAMVPFSWTGSTDTETAGTYTYQGVPVLDAETDNRNNVQTSTQVIVKKRLVSVVHSPAAINVAYNTAFNQTGFPASIQVDFDNGSKAQVPVSWLTGSYDPVLPQTYTLTGNLQIDVNTDNPAGATAQVQVTVDKRFISSISRLADIHVTLGSDPADIRIPATVNIIYSDVTSAAAGISWAGNTNTAQAGHYTYTGKVIMDAVTDNRNQLFAGMQVIVDKRNMTAVAALNNVTVPVGTAFQQLTLPATARISYDNGDHADAAITWLPGNFDGNTAGTYGLAGTLAVDANSTNPQGLAATITVNVNKLQQQIQYTAPGVIHEGDADYDLKALSSAGLPVSIQSGNPQIVSIQGGHLRFEQPGKAIITLSQTGTGTYEPAAPVTFDIEVLAWPEAAISAGSGVVFCQGDRVVLTATPGAAWQWLHDGIAVTNATAQTLEASASGNYQVQVTYANGFRKTSVPVTVTVHPLPVGTISANNTNISKGSVVQLQADGGDSYNWTSTATLSNSSIANPVSRPESDARYEVTITSTAGCSVKKDITISVKSDFNLTATNMLTPNGDGINDTWVIKNIDMYRQNELKIFDRSGRLVYSAKQYTNNWNGTVNGQPLSEGTYYYILEFENGKHRMKGFITIIR